VAERAAWDPVEWGLATRCRRGEVTSGDLAVVQVLPEGALFAAIDGLGHGGEAAFAARTAGEIVRERPSQDLVLLVERCHEALRDTRGAAISLAFVSAAADTMTWLGVGNVEGRVLSGTPSTTRLKGSLVLQSGILGHELPHVSASTIDVRPGDVVVLATDGIEAAFGDSLDTAGPTQAITDRVLAAHGKPTDDALVVAVRYLGARR
jgi:negative regulator of sigma-B (phosphoserine phosphatase)